MIKVPVRVDCKIDRTTTNLTNGIAYLWHEFRELVIHNHHTLTPHADTDVSASAKKNIEVIRHFLGRDFHGAQIPAKRIHEFI